MEPVPCKGLEVHGPPPGVSASLEPPVVLTGVLAMFAGADQGLVLTVIPRAHVGFLLFMYTVCVLNLGLVIVIRYFNVY